MANDETKTQFMMAVCMAMADGKLDDGEAESLAKIAIRCGLTDEEVAEIFNDLDSVNITPPKDRDAAIGWINNMMRVMASDGHIDDSEIALLVKLALSLGLSADDVTQIIDAKQWV